MNRSKPLKIWSGRGDSNPRPQPWQGCALPLSYTRTGRGGSARGAPHLSLEGPLCKACVPAWWTASCAGHGGAAADQIDSANPFQNMAPIWRSSISFCQEYGIVRFGKIILVPDDTLVNGYKPGLPTKTVPAAQCPLIGWVVDPANDTPIKFDGLIDSADLRNVTPPGAELRSRSRAILRSRSRRIPHWPTALH